MVCYEASRSSSRVDYVPSAVFHSEPQSIFDVWAKNYRYEKTIAAQRREESYVELISAKNRRLVSSKGPNRLKWRSILFLASKARAYFLGQALGGIRCTHVRFSDPRAWRAIDGGPRSAENILDD